MNSNDRERWCLARLVDYELGLLEHDDQEAVEEVLLVSERCRRAFEALQGDACQDDYDFEHIPPDMIARWDRVTTSAKGLERVLLRDHLEGCDSCRREIELAGGVPLIPFEADLDISPAETARILGDSTPDSPAPSKVVRKPNKSFWRNRGQRDAGRRNLVPWAVSGWSLAAAAALFILLVQPGGLVETGDPEGGVLPMLGLRTVRSGPLVLEVERTTRQAAVHVLVPGSLSTSQPLVVEVENPAGKKIWRLHVQTEEMASGDVLFAWPLPKPLESGTYQFRLWNGVRDSEPSGPQVEYSVQVILSR